MFFVRPSAELKLVNVKPETEVLVELILMAAPAPCLIRMLVPDKSITVGFVAGTPVTSEIEVAATELMPVALRISALRRSLIYRACENVSC